MGQIIYITGAIETSGLTDDQAKYIEVIEDGWGCDCFKVEDNWISFIHDCVEGCTPLLDGVERPLADLLTYLRKQKVTLKSETAIDIGSDCYDYDNITIVIDPETLETRYENTQIRYADDNELIEELKKRGYSITKEAAA